MSFQSIASSFLFVRPSSNKKEIPYLLGLPLPLEALLFV